jgi:hypothetical protein
VKHANPVRSHKKQRRRLKHPREVRVHKIARERRKETSRKLDDDPLGLPPERRHLLHEARQVEHDPCAAGGQVRRDRRRERVREERTFHVKRGGFGEAPSVVADAGRIHAGLDGLVADDSRASAPSVKDRRRHVRLADVGASPCDDEEGA